jgi:hypothetical protein
MNNFETVTTPADLVELNKVELSAAEKAVEALKECDYSESKVIIEWLLTNCITFHKEEAVKALNSETPADSIAWVEDVKAFTVAKDIIEGVA